MPFVRLLAGRTAVDKTSGNLEEAHLYASIYEDLAIYLYKHPDVRAIVRDGNDSISSTLVLQTGAS